jgi:hypothetical protein
MTRPDSDGASGTAIDFDRYKAQAKALRDGALRVAFGRLLRALGAQRRSATPGAANRAGVAEARWRRAAADNDGDEARLADALSLGSPAAAAE